MRNQEKKKANQKRLQYYQNRQRPTRDADKWQFITDTRAFYLELQAKHGPAQAQQELREMEKAWANRRKIK